MMTFPKLISFLEARDTVVVSYEWMSDYEMPLLHEQDHSFILQSNLDFNSRSTFVDVVDLVDSRDDKVILLLELDENLSAEEFKQIETFYNNLEDKSGVFPVYNSRIHSFTTDQKKFHFSA